MMTLRNLILLVLILAVTGCSSLPSLDKVLPDKRTAYRKSRDMHKLEVPPDLTVTKGEYAAAIPGEEESTSLSEFQRQRIQNAGGGVVLGGGEFEGEQWLALQGTPADIWPKLREFWKAKGYKLDLDDAELGVLETDWKEGEGEKYKFKIFTEPGQEGGTTLFLSSEKQDLSEGTWLDAEPDMDKERDIIRKLSLHFHGTVLGGTGRTRTASSDSSSTSPASPKAIKPKAEVHDVGEGKSYLAIPQEFTRAWRDTELIIQRAGYEIEDSDQEKGTYNFLYYRPKGEKKKSLLDKLKFWGDDEDEGTFYQLSLTGVGDKTEIIVMNEKGKWETGEDAIVILNTLRDMYNQL